MTASMNFNNVGLDTIRRVSCYPMAIMRACAAIEEISIFQDMPDSYFTPMLRLVKKLSVSSPFQPIYAKRETLAKESRKSTETIGRLLRWLEDRELITRNQKARPGLRGSTSHIQPTQKLITLLGLDGKNTGSACSTGGSISAKQNINLKKQSEEIGFSKNSDKTADPTLIKRQFLFVDGKKIPVDLVWIVKEGNLRATGVLQLMKLAKDSGKRLSDVVQITRKYLNPLKGRALYAYIRSLLLQNKDYGYLIRSENDIETKQQQLIQQKELLARKASEWIGRRFKSLDGSMSYTVDRYSFVEWECNGKRGSQPLSMKFIEDVMEGKLRSVAS